MGDIIPLLSFRAPRTRWRNRWKQPEGLMMEKNIRLPGGKGGLLTINFKMSYQTRQLEHSQLVSLGKVWRKSSQVPKVLADVGWEAPNAGNQLCFQNNGCQTAKNCQLCVYNTYAHLGMVEYRAGGELLYCFDLPGIIEGAAEVFGSSSFLRRERSSSCCFFIPPIARIHKKGDTKKWLERIQPELTHKQFITPFLKPDMLEYFRISDERCWK